MPIGGMITTAAGFVSYMGGSGVYRPDSVEFALAMAEGEAMKILSTALTPTQFTDEFPWPVDGNKMWLRKVRLITVDTVLSLYSNGDCTWTEGTECSTIFDNRESIIRIRDPWRRWCASLRCPERMRVTYTAGLSAADIDATTIDGATIRAAIYEIAQAFLEMGVVGLQGQGNLFISSFTAAGYSESRQLPETSGAYNYMNQHYLLGKEWLRRFEVKRAINFRSRNVGRAC